MRYVLPILASLLVTTACGGTHEKTLVDNPHPQMSWPTQGCATDCLPIQFNTLAMRLSLHHVSRVLVTDEPQTVIHFLPPDGTPERAVHLQSVPPENLLDRYRAAGLLDGLDIGTPRQLFDALTSAPGNHPGLATIRQIEGIDDATRLRRAEHDPFTVFWLVPRAGGMDSRAYITIKGESVVYLLAGAITEPLLHAMLADLAWTQVP